MDLFVEVIKRLKHGTQIVFTPDNVADGDDFLLFSSRYRLCRCTFRNEGLWYVDFDDDTDETMLLEDCPKSFFRSILKNIDKVLF